LYANVLHRTPDADGFKFWLNALDKEGVPRAHLLAQFSESPENQNNVYDSIKDGITHTPWIVGTDINETLRPVGGDNVINGQGGLDTAVYAGARSTYTLEKIDGGYSITDKVGYGGHDKLFNVERLVFDDATIALDVDGHGGQAYRLVEAGLGRVPTAAELGQWIARLDGGASLDQAASELIASAAFTQKYGTNETDTAFVTGLYTNVWHNAPDSATLDSWVTELHNTSRAHVLVEFSESATNQAQVIGSIQNGIVYTPLHA
jgi:serralysin